MVFHSLTVLTQSSIESRFGAPSLSCSAWSFASLNILARCSLAVLEWISFGSSSHAATVSSHASWFSGSAQVDLQARAESWRDFNATVLFQSAFLLTALLILLFDKYIYLKTRCLLISGELLTFMYCYFVWNAEYLFAAFCPSIGSYFGSCSARVTISMVILM